LRSLKENIFAALSLFSLGILFLYLVEGTAAVSRITWGYDDVFGNRLINMPRNIHNMLAIHIHDRVNVRDNTRSIAIAITDDTSWRAHHWSRIKHTNHLQFHIK
jgi:hypothetical protein